MALFFFFLLGRARFFLDICSDEKSSIVGGMGRVDLWARSFGGLFLLFGCIA